MIVNHDNFSSIKEKLEKENKDFEVLELVFKDIKNKDNFRKRAYLKVKHLSCGYEFLTPTAKIKDNVLKCPKCVYKKKDNDTFKNEFNNTSNNEYILLSDYHKVSEKIKVKHLKCGNEYEVTPNKWLSGKRCPFCYGPNRITKEIFRNKFNETCDNEYILLSDYINTKTKVKVKHLKCGNEYEVTPNKWLNNRRCPICRESKGEKAIEKYLKENNINFKRQYTFKDCKDTNPLPFDFVVFYKNNNIRCLIEFDGEFHFSKRYTDITGELLEKTKKHDNIKNEYCKTNNIPLLRIREIKDIKKSIEKMFNDYPEKE